VTHTEAIALEEWNKRIAKTRRYELAKKTAHDRVRPTPFGFIGKVMRREAAADRVPRMNDSWRGRAGAARYGNPERVDWSGELIQR
jgi:hypothetical protein